MDEIAAAVKLDPLEFRRKNLKDARLRPCSTRPRERFGWAKAKRRRVGLGSPAAPRKAATSPPAPRCASSRAAPCAWCASWRAFECGASCNPDQLENQVEGSLVMGLGGALFEAVEFDRGVIQNARLSRYRVPRFSDVPQIDVVLVDARTCRPREPARRRSSPWRRPWPARSFAATAAACGPCRSPAGDCRRRRPDGRAGR
jgi:isoquinoline 1-oxidoreductase